MAQEMNRSQMKELPASAWVEPLGSVGYWDMPGGGKRVRAFVLRKPQVEGAKMGLAIDGSQPMEDLFGKKPLVAWLRLPSNQVRPAARAMIAHLARWSADGKVTAIYWATGPGGDDIQELGDLTVKEAEKFHFGPPIHYGTGIQLLPALQYFTDGQPRGNLHDAPWGMYVFITSGIIDDMDAVKQYCTQLAKDIHAGWRNELKLIIIGLGNQVDQDQLEELDDLATGTGIDLWDAKFAWKMKDLVTIFTEVVSEGTFVAPHDGIIWDEAGNMIVDYRDIGLPGLLQFDLPPGAKSFSLEIDGHIFTQPLPQPQGHLARFSNRLKSSITAKKRLRKSRSGSFSISCLGGRRPVRIAADERDSLFVVWNNGIIQAYPKNNEEQPFSTRLVDVGTHPKILDVSAYQEDESSGCYVLLQLPAKTLLFKVNNTGKVVERHDDLPAGICNVSCHKDQLHLYNNGPQEVDEYCKIPVGAHVINAVSEKMFPWQEYLTELSQTTVTHLDKDKLHTICCDLGIDHSNLPEDHDEQKKELIKSIESRRDSEQLRIPHSFIVGEDHLFVVGESQTGRRRHCIWVRSRFAEGAWQSYSWQNRVYATRNLEDERLYVITDEHEKGRALVLLDPSSPTDVELSPKKKIHGGSAVAANLDCLFILDSGSSSVFWYGHTWLTFWTKQRNTDLSSRGHSGNKNAEEYGDSVN